MNILNIINEEIVKYLKQEGVADVAAEKRFNIANPQTAMEKKADSYYKNYKNGELVGQILGHITTNVYANPLSLEDFDENVRAIGDGDGNLFVAQFNESFMHEHISSAIARGGKYVVPAGTKIYLMTHKYILLHRINNTNKFGLSVSSMDAFNALPDSINDIIAKIKQKNPRYDISNKQWDTLVEY
jgi:hypothetical protein